MAGETKDNDFLENALETPMNSYCDVFIAHEKNI